MRGCSALEVPTETRPGKAAAAAACFFFFFMWVKSCDLKVQRSGMQTRWQLPDPDLHRFTLQQEKVF